ncbi:PDDEXK nuclease domain-containing protein [Oscillatoria sp. CS-180]|uniref:PDDEXK nuclease domain-containing protein n=1 Tax=Oscillatoria sp. CS-180 TaxID=3021720 RepID=UPI002330C535|nr:PDDEXK nuclease domain-containing protein [Oscillatoria sp. CS-180]MDB9524825.1 PDDEXK nuclease domain-containing protein [Oscillatoria sp. CS-180]
MPKSNLVPDDDYRVLLEELKGRIRSSQIKAAIAVNQELILLYWQIGREILVRQKQQGWGSKVIARLSQDLKREFPDMKGFSTTNLKYMRAFADAWSSFEISQQVLTHLPWGQNTVLLSKLDDTEERLWYAHKAIEHEWSRSALTRHIENKLYQQRLGGVNNFDLTLPKPQSDLARQLIRDPYHLDFLYADENTQDQDLKRLLMAHMREFLLTLGVGFSFVGHNYPIHVGGEDFCVDMLFYHLRLRCFVVIQLEMGEFKPEQSGQMNFYLSAVDSQERQEHDQPTIGIILCSSKNHIIAEYALRNLHNPIAVTEHRIPNVLPSPEQLEFELEHVVKRVENKDS